MGENILFGLNPSTVLVDILLLLYSFQMQLFQRVYHVDVLIVEEYDNVSLTLDACNALSKIEFNLM